MTDTVFVTERVLETLVVGVCVERAVITVRDALTERVTVGLLVLVTEVVCVVDRVRDTLTVCVVVTLLVWDDVTVCVFDRVLDTLTVPVCVENAVGRDAVGDTDRVCVTLIVIVVLCVLLTDVVLEPVPVVERD